MAVENQNKFMVDNEEQVVDTTKKLRVAIIGTD